MKTRIILISVMLGLASILPATTIYFWLIHDNTGKVVSSYIGEGAPRVSTNQQALLVGENWVRLWIENPNRVIVTNSNPVALSEADTNHRLILDGNPYDDPAFMRELLYRMASMINTNLTRAQWRIAQRQIWEATDDERDTSDGF